MDNQSKKLGDLIEQARGMFVLNPMIEPQLKQFWKVQDDILDEAEEFSSAWFERRHDATKTALEAVKKANGDGFDPAAAMKAMFDWQQSSSLRLANDMQHWVEFCSRCAGRMTQAQLEAGQAGAEEVAKRTKSVAKTKPSTSA